jgi:hypothetical protein
MTAHTLGPWQQFRAAGNQPAIKQAGPTGKYLFDVSEYPGLGDEAEANFRLIAAAPDLLEALKRAVTQLETRVDPLQVAQQCRAAIAKAEGR